MNTIFRVAYRNLPFSQIGNDMLRDTRLSIEARGLLAMVLTYPADWEFSREWLRKSAGVGEKQQERIVRELRTHDYCRCERKRLPDGTMGAALWLFTDQPGVFSEPPKPQEPRPRLTPKPQEPPGGYRPAETAALTNKETNRKEASRRRRGSWRQAGSFFSDYRPRDTDESVLEQVRRCKREGTLPADWPE